MENEMQILVIEDDERIVSFVRRGLEGEGHRVKWVMTGFAAHEAVDQRDSAYDVIIIDWHLGQEDGLVICREFRTRKVETPILIMSARGEVDVEQRSDRAGANAFLAKPFSFEQLLTLLHELTCSGPRLVTAE